MTYDTDPTRWTDAPHNAPDSLRDAFAAARNEGPNDLQMRALALKLAAMSGGAALAASSSAAHASTTGAAAASSGGALSLGKIALSVALVSAVAAGTAYYRTSKPSLPQQAERAPATVVEPPAPAIVQPSEAPHQRRAEKVAREEPSLLAAERSAPTAEAPAVADQVGLAAADAMAKEPTQGASSSAREPAPRAQPRTVAQQRERAVRKVRAAVERRLVEERAVAARDDVAPKARERSAVTGELKTPEIQLLRRARENLDSRPHEAFRLTEQHRREYPNGVFGQERDALAIEALLRAGDVGKARSRAEDFVDTYPSSPHAHRFRETMKLGD